MLKLFRKIRQDLLKQNQFKKYLLYAIGEIFLVVIGILIALQINNWNEKSKADDLSHEMILELKTGIESDLKELKKFISSQQNVMKSQIIISDWMKNEKGFHDSLALHLTTTYVTTDYTVNYAGYETLKQFGLRRISNDSLRRSIANLYEIKYPSLIKFSNIYQNFLEKLLAHNGKHFNELNYVNTSMKPLNVSKLKSDDEFLYHLNSLKNFNFLLIYQASTLMTEMEKTYRMFSN